MVPPLSFWNQWFSLLARKARCFSGMLRIEPAKQWLIMGFSHSRIQPTDTLQENGDIFRVCQEIREFAMLRIASFD